jgi:hypothetical protein
MNEINNAWRAKNPDYPKWRNTPEYNKQYRDTNPEYFKQKRQESKAQGKYTADKDYRLQKKFGIGLNEYNNMLSKQNNSCVICEQQLILPQVDHCHTTGKVRGLLCMHCNTALGKFKDDTATLQRAINYLNQHKKEE